MNVCKYVCMYECMYVCTYVRMYVCMYVSICSVCDPSYCRTLVGLWVKDNCLDEKEGGRKGGRKGGRRRRRRRSRKGAVKSVGVLLLHSQARYCARLTYLNDFDEAKVKYCLQDERTA